MSRNEPSNDNASSIWKMLDEMAENDPENYKKFISKQMDVGKSLCSRPKCRAIYLCRLMDDSKLFLNLCEWEMVQNPITPTDPVPILYGDKCIIENATAIFLAFHPIVFNEHGFDQNGNKGDNLPKTSLSEIDLIKLSLVYLFKEKDINTKEYTKMLETGNSPKLRKELSSEPHGGEEAMLKAFRYKNADLSKIAQDAVSFSDIPCVSTAAPNINISIATSKIENAKKCLIMEVKDEKSDKVLQWKRDDKKSRLSNSLVYHIYLPSSTTMQDCELDISKTKISLKLLNIEKFADPFIAEFPEWVKADNGIAKLNRKNMKLTVTVPLA